MDNLKEKKDASVVEAFENVKVLVHPLLPQPASCCLFSLVLYVLSYLFFSSSSSDFFHYAQPPVVDKRPPLSARLWDMVLQYYHGFRLLALDIRVAFRLFLKTIRGSTLTRRENKQFRRTVADMFRIVPFSVFIIIPFMEFLLPVYLYLFPNALPSTFQSSSSKVVS